MQAPQTLESLIGRVLDDRYRIEEMIGVGGCGAVFRGRSIKLPKPVAIKVLLPDGDFARKDAQNRVRRFAQEARATSSLRHPNTIQVFDYGTTDEGLMYLVMEYLDGSTLRVVRQALNTLPVDRACHIAAQICDSLAEAHEHGIIHRDLKPDNVFLCNVHGDPDFVKVLDFGIAKMLESDSEHDDLAPQTKTGLISGTPRYMSPEQAMGEASDGRSDLYSLGVMLFEALAGHPPFTAATPIALLHKHLTEPPPAIGRGCPPELEKLIAELLEKNPTHRPANATSVAQRLRRIRTHYVTSGLATGEYERADSSSNLTRIMLDPAMISHQSSLEVAAPPRPAKRGRMALALTAAIVTIVAAGVTWIFLKSSSESSVDSAEFVGARPNGVPAETGPSSQVSTDSTHHVAGNEAGHGGPMPTTSGATGDNVRIVVSPNPTDAGSTATAAADVIHDRGAHLAAGSGQGMQTPTDVAPGVKLSDDVVKLQIDAETKLLEPVDSDQPRQLAVSSKPGGAQVVANGVSVCETPCTLPIRDLLEPIRVEVRKDGYVPMVYSLGTQGQMSVADAVEAGLSADLQRKMSGTVANTKKSGSKGSGEKKPALNPNTPSKYDDTW